MTAADPSPVRMPVRTSPAWTWIVRGGILLVAAWAILVLADAASESDGVTALDRPVWSWLVDHRSAGWTTVMRAVTEIGGTGVLAGLALVVAAVLAWRRPDRRGDALLIAVVVAGVGALVTVSKPIVGRVRPPLAQRLVEETNQSFPSGHATASVAVLGVLVLILLPHLYRRWARLLVIVGAVLVVALIGLSRLYLGVHWATDVVGGWLTGATWLYGCLSVRTVLRKRPAVSRLPRWEWPTGGPAGSRTSPSSRRP